jgi:stringent starvation protein B
MSTPPKIHMLSNRSYLLRAFYDWIVDSQCTPYVIVDTENHPVQVPREIIQKGKVTFNVSPDATRNFKIDYENLSFLTRFSGVTREISAPVDSITAIYALENGRGMIFEAEDFMTGVSSKEPTVEPKIEAKAKPHLELVSNPEVSSESSSTPKKDRSHLKIVE